MAELQDEVEGSMKTGIVASNKHHSCVANEINQPRGVKRPLEGIGGGGRTTTKCCRIEGGGDREDGVSSRFFAQGYSLHVF